MRLAAVLVVALLPAACLAAGEAPSPDVACAAAGTWLEPGSGRTLGRDAVVRRADAGIVLLGELHDDPDHHRWQVHMLAALHGRRPDMAIGVEMLPRRAQPALDRWVAGGLGKAQFLEEVRWKDTWGHDPDLYMPLFDFARVHRVPMVALNVERSLVAKVARQGWAAVPRGEREGIGNPAPAVEAYRRSLASVVGDGSHGGVRAERFTEAQLPWDRAMAEAIAAATRARPATLVVAIAGRGHLEHGWGIPRQLADLGAPRPMVLLPVGDAEACAPAPDLADARPGPRRRFPQPALTASEPPSRHHSGDVCWRRQRHPPARPTEARRSTAMTDHPPLGATEAHALAQAALLIEQARDAAALAAALAHSRALWQSIRETVARASGSLPEGVKANLDKVGAAVLASTAQGDAGGAAEATCSTLININRRISAGLLDGQAGPLA